MNSTNSGTGTRTKASAGIASALDAAGQGATVITVNKRSARVLLAAYAERMRDAGEHTWRTPDVLSWDAFLLRLWSELVYGGRSNGCVLLNASQERRLWEQVVEPECGAVLNPSATAGVAARAWKLMKQYRIPMGALGERTKPRRGATSESETFRSWIDRFESACRERKWIDSASLCDSVVPEAKEVTGPGRGVVLLGFDELTPQQQALLDRLQARGTECKRVEAVAGAKAEAVVVAAKNAAEEIRAAANWARAIVEANPEASIGIAVPSLHNVRSQIESIFLATFHPDQLPPGAADGQRAFEISLGLALAEYPVIAAGLLALKLAAMSLPLAEAGALLRSPFFAGGEAEMTARARLDRGLREERVLEVTLPGLRDAALSHCPVLRERLAQVAALGKVAGGKRSAREWSDWAAEVLNALGWPSGERGLNSEEYQAVESWTRLFSEFGSLESVEPAMDPGQFVTELRDCASQVTFEPEKHGVPVQVVGLLEAAGTHFDHLWVMGLHDGAWPEHAAPNPFIPISVQLQYGLPHASPEIQLEFAKRVRERLLHSAGQVVLSYPQYEGEVMLRPSVLLAGFPRTELAEVPGEAFEGWGDKLFGSCKGEEISDESGPPIAEGTSVKGGTWTLELQSACPFRAFVELRLGGKKLESPTPGLDSRQRGEIVHKALQYAWGELRAQAGLRDCPDLRGMVSRWVEQAIEAAEAGGSERWERSLAAIEQERVTALILELLAMERNRKPFTVIESEKEEKVELGGLKIRMKADRMDRLEDGRLVLIDYKTGAVTPKSWDGARPEKPQLPAYAATTEGDIAAVAFAQLKIGEVKFCGYSPDNAVIDAGDYSRTTPGKANEPLPAVVARWREIVERLAREHREGRAAVDPALPEAPDGKKKEPTVCQYCPMPALCRINDNQIRSEEQDDDE